MPNSNNIPKLRFPEFTDPWEQRKLGDIYTFQYGEFNNNPDNGGKYPIYGANGIIGGYTKSNAEDSAVIGHMGAYAGYVVWAEGKHFVTYNGTIAKPSDDSTDSKFGFYLLSSKQIYRICAGSGQPFVSYADLNNIDVQIPKEKNEQQKLGTYLTNLDNLITLHQRKCDEAKKLKNCMLQKMFPKDGEQFPEIRFPGFTDAWEQRKLGEIADKVTTKNVGTQYIETLTNSAEFGIISQRDFFDHDVSNMENIDGYYIVEDDSFVYNPRISTSAPVGPINRNKLGRTGVMSPLYTVFKAHDIDPEYLEWFFKSTRWHTFMKFNGDSGARSDRFSIKDSVFFEMPIPIPNIDEQKKIGKYMTQLDNLITLHQRKCDEIKSLKKSLLQQMFV